VTAGGRHRAIPSGRRPGRSPTLVNSIWGAFGEGGRILTQGLLLLVLARVLGPAPFGRFAGATALLQLCGPLIWFGAPSLLVMRYASRTASLSEACSTATTTIAGSGLLGIGVVLALRPLILPKITWQDFLILALAELVFSGLVENFAVAGWAIERLALSAAIRWFSGGLRVAGLAIFVALRGSGSQEHLWYIVYLLCTICAAVATALLLRIAAGMRLRLSFPRRAQLLVGLPFSIGSTAFSVQDSIDTPLVLDLSSATAAGIYSAAYRVVVVALVPIRALLMSIYASMFRVGKVGLTGTAPLARRYTSRMLPYGIVAVAMLILTSSWVSSFFGPGFSETASAIRWLAPLPVLRVLNTFVGDALTGAGWNGKRIRIQLLTATFHVALCVILIPKISWHGAAVATFASESLLAGLLWALLRRMEKTYPAGGPGPATPSAWESPDESSARIVGLAELT